MVSKIINIWWNAKEPLVQILPLSNKTTEFSVTHVQRNGSDNFVDANNGEAQSYRPSQGDRESQAQSQPQQRHQPQQYHSYNNGSQSNGYASSEQQYYDQNQTNNINTNTNHHSNNIEMVHHQCHNIITTTTTTMEQFHHHSNNIIKIITNQTQDLCTIKVMEICM